MNPDLRVFIDRVIVPALLERFLREQAAAAARGPVAVSVADLPKPEATA